MTITSNPDFASVAKADFAIDIIGKIIKFNHVISGLAIAKVGGDPTLTFSIANGTAFINGVFLNVASEANQTVPINQTNKIYLQLSKSGTSPDGGVIGKTTGALPADSIQLAEIISDGTTITTVTDKRDIIDPLVLGYASSLSDFNATKFNGQLRYDTVGKKWKFWDGTLWKNLGGGGGSVGYPYAMSYKEAIDHFTEINFPTYLGVNVYANAGNGTLLSINQGSNDEFDNHSVWASQILNTNERGNWTDRHAVYHTKRDIDDSFTKVNIEFRSKFRTRVANLEHWLGVVDGVVSVFLSTTTVRKITVYENNGNYQLRTSDGTTQSDLDTGTVGDTSAHKFRMVWSNVPNVEILIDGVSKGTKTTNIPDNALHPIMAMKNGSGADQNGDIHDYWHTKYE